MSNELNPITREELFLAAAAGQDVTVPEPITRKEMFLAKLVNKDAAVPAAITRDEYFIEAAAEARNASVIVPLEITENGTYTAPAGVDGYNPVTVAVAGSSAELHYVTFMNRDGTKELGKKAVADGDDCADPVARGIFDTPTEESTDQYNFTFSGSWATVPNGGADANALKAVTEDRVVYAHFIETVRYYTITYYDDDGATVLKTESLAYGAMPSYKPQRDDALFSEWSPVPSAVTGDASYTAVWGALPSFTDGTWEDIKTLAYSGNASAYFKVGDTRTETLTYSDGTSEQITWVIADVDGSYDVSRFPDGTVPHLAIIAAHALSEKKQMHSSSYAGYTSSDLHKWLNNEFLSANSAEMQGVVKEAGMRAEFHQAKIFLLDRYELGVQDTTDSYSFKKFLLFTSDESRIRKQGLNGDAIEYWTRGEKATGSNYTFYTITKTGAANTSVTSAREERGVVPAFFI